MKEFVAKGASKNSSLNPPGQVGFSSGGGRWTTKGTRLVSSPREPRSLRLVLAIKPTLAVFSPPFMPRISSADALPVFSAHLESSYPADEETDRAQKQTRATDKPAISNRADLFVA